MLRASFRPFLRPSLCPVAKRLGHADERTGKALGFCTAPLPPQGHPKKGFGQPAVWTALAILGGGATYGVAHDAAVQTRRSESPTHVTIGHALSDGEMRQRLGAFVESLRTIDAVELHWWSPTTARVVGQYLEGDIRVREGWVEVTMRVHGPLRVRSQSLHQWMVQNLRRAMES